jgi:hypothetical protein
MLVQYLVTFYNFTNNILINGNTRALDEVLRDVMQPMCFFGVIWMCGCVPLIIIRACRYNTTT